MRRILLRTKLSPEQIDKALEPFGVYVDSADGISPRTVDGCFVLCVLGPDLVFLREILRSYQCGSYVREYNSTEGEVKLWKVLVWHKPEKRERLQFVQRYIVAAESSQQASMRVRAAALLVPGVHDDRIGEILDFIEIQGPVTDLWELSSTMELRRKREKL